MEIVADTNEGGFGASYPDLPGCITCGETLEAVAKNAQEAKRVWLTAALEDGITIREPDAVEADMDAIIAENLPAWNKLAK